MTEPVSTRSQLSDAQQLLVSLVETPSVTGTEAECAALLADFFERHGREVRQDEVGNVHAPADDSVLLTSHIDTVPGDISVRLDENDDGELVLWGRGSVDAKGPLAAMAVAAVRTGVSFVGVVGEEVDSRGSRAVVENREAPGVLVNGEPSGWDGITLGYRGMLAGTYSTTTDSTHSSRPENNAIQDAFEWYARVESALDTGGDLDSDSALESESDTSTEKDSDTPPETNTFDSVTWTPTAIDGGVAADGLAVEATMNIEARVPPGENTEAVQETIAAQTETGEIEWTDAIEPVIESPRTSVARAFRVAIRDEDGEPRLLKKTGTSDMNIFAQHWECPMVTYGPGDSALDHTPDEHIVLSEYDRAVAVLTTATEQLLQP